ncbi:MAG: TetR/AcrR family transcriptional regulator [Bacillota bacterium]|nr:TetR/AcrR family transcriptional regulator [Bacillota bacterium]MDW7678325.1 TetR/AcrR family transcriptional regulator [Bacillota bacterium]
MSQDQIDTRTKVLEASKKLFAKNGFSATSIREIAIASGVNSAAVSYHFGGKENLLIAIFEACFPKPPHLTANSGTNYLAELDRLIRAIIGLRFSDPDLVNLMQQEIILKTARTQILAAFLSPFWEAIAENLSRGREAGVYDFDDLGNAVKFVMSVLSYPRHDLTLEFLKGAFEQAEPEDLIEENVRLILKALCA